MSEWLKEIGCKPIGYAYAGSNPAPATIRRPFGARDLVRWIRSRRRLGLRSARPRRVLLGAALRRYSRRARSSSALERRRRRAASAADGAATCRSPIRDPPRRVPARSARARRLPAPRRWTCAGTVARHPAQRVMALVSDRHGDRLPGARSRRSLLVAAGPIGMLSRRRPGAPATTSSTLALLRLVRGPGRWSADLDRGRSPSRQRAVAYRDLVHARLRRPCADHRRLPARSSSTRPKRSTSSHEHPDLELSKQLGLGVVHRDVRARRPAIEVLFGMLLISGAMPQAIVLIAASRSTPRSTSSASPSSSAACPSTASMLVLLVYGRTPNTRPLVKRFMPARPVRRSAQLAQLVEHLHGKEGVAGSSPALGFFCVTDAPTRSR